MGRTWQDATHYTCDLEFEAARKLTLVHRKRFREIRSTLYDRINHDSTLKSSALALRVAWKLFDHVNVKIGGAKAGCAWPSHEYLATELAVSEKGVRNAIELLERAGYIFVQHKRRRGNLYAINVARGLDRIDQKRNSSSVSADHIGGRDEMITEPEFPDNSTPVPSKRNWGSVHPGYNSPYSRPSSAERSNQGARVGSPPARTVSATANAGNPATSDRGRSQTAAIASDWQASTSRPRL